ncbi:GNAT family N-acetyltransferase [Metabacillus sp. KIGAM252]|uniref:GNAT family N-acetyltransferase n=1 Tax=Metabacillus flavus TaxID=2823519 RepID=A0ABS5LCV5_9BACI|nr:GNAT family N-acetyltransferase [Metabacillus flavus]MBS2968581.1 GNAT family N-acetyltransferase [Metabacillus flavus]
MIRPLLIEYASSHLELLIALDQQTDTLLYEHGERSSDSADYRNRLSASLNKQLFIWVSEDQDGFHGHLAVLPCQLNRNRHKASVVIGLLPEYQNMGIGGKLMDTAVAWSKLQGLHRLELTVMTHNEPAIALYKKKKFSLEGTVRHSLLVNGEWVDEYIMGRLL